MPTLAVEALSVRYGSVDAVRGVSLTCAAGELVALVGPNGAGKTSTLLAIAGGNHAARVTGDVTLDGVSMTGCPPELVSSAGIVLVPERRHIFEGLTVAENLLVGASGWARRADGLAAVDEMLTRFPALAESRGRAGGLLSGGQQQQLAIARALMARPRVLLLDEPSLGLSPAMVDVVFGMIQELRRDGMAVVLVEQAVVRAVEIADRSYAMRKGSIDGNVDEGELDGFVEAYFGAVDPAEGRA